MISQYAELLKLNRLVRCQENLKKQNMTETAQIYREEMLTPLTRAACTKLYNRNFAVLLRDASKKVRESFEKELQRNIEECVKKHTPQEPKQEQSKE